MEGAVAYCISGDSYNSLMRSQQSLEKPNTVRLGLIHDSNK